MKVLGQIGLVAALTLVCEGISAVLPFPVPGSVLAMLLLLALFVCKVIKPDQIKEVSDFCLGNITLVFIPPVVSLVNYLDFLWAIIVPFLLIIVIASLITFTVAVFTVKGVIYLQDKVQGSGGAKNA